MTQGEPNPPKCQHGDHAPRERQTPLPSIAAFERTAQMFRALGDVPRLRILEMLSQGEFCVSEIVEATQEKFSTVSQRLRLLRTEGLIRRRRKGTHIFYALADQHVEDLLHVALAHAEEISSSSTASRTSTSQRKGNRSMAHTHSNHDHKHGPNCGHTAIQHGNHVDYLHDGHLHHMAQGGVEEHKLEVNGQNPASCTPKHDCGGHEKGHKHGPNCGHEAVPHGDHVDYLVNGHLHHPHGDHCDDHGKVQVK